jgi:hypothetical protein
MSLQNYLFIEFSNTNDSSKIIGNYHQMAGNEKILRFNYGELCPINIADSLKRTIITIGHPSFNNTINSNNFISEYTKIPLKKLNKFFSQIDGEFLLIDFDKSTDRISVINSRFSSPAVFYAIVSQKLLLSTSYSMLFKYLISNKLATILPNKIYELLSFRRLFGSGTYDDKSKYLEGASKLSYGKKITIDNYWKPDIYSNNFSLNDNADKLVDLLTNSINFKTSDKKRYGIMQSGGLDTRMILSGFKSPPHAFNITYEKNREYKIAKKLVDYKNGDFSWIQVRNGQYKNYFDYGSQVTGGMFQNSSLFYGHRSIIKKNCDVLFSGYGLDYFFQGMYLPSKMYSIFGEPVPWFKTLGKFNVKIIDYFIKNISYQTKGFAIDNIMSAKQIGIKSELIYNSIEAQYHKAKLLSEDNYAIYEYMSLGDLSRHYTYTGQLSLMELSEYRTISYTNDILNFYYSLPLKHRFDARVLRKALSISDKRFFNLPSANHGFSAGSSSFEKSLKHIYKYLPERVGLKEKKRNFERTWLTAEEVLRNELYEEVNQLANSEVIADLNVIDMDKLKKIIKLWNCEEVVGNQSLMMLLTVDSFFKQTI